MRRWLAILCTSLLVSLSFGVGAKAQDTPAVPIETPAKHAVIMDHRTGAVLFAKDADASVPPASMSKLMTAAIVFDLLDKGKLSLDTPFRVSERAWGWQGSKMWVLVDTDITVENLLRGLIIQSGNDAGIVLAENIAGSEAAFADLMNEKARQWGLVDSFFVNATGWPGEGQRMSAMDLARLARRIIDRHPDYYEIFSENEFTWSKISQSNRNPLLGAFVGADGLKTGHTEEAGFGLVGSAVRDGKRRIIVLNGLESARARIREAQRLMSKSFDDFETVQIFPPEQPLHEIDVFKGKKPSVTLSLREPVQMLVHKKLVPKISATVQYDGPVAAPVLANQQIGRLIVNVPGRPALQYPLYADDNVGVIGWAGKIALAARKLLLKPEDAATAGLAPRPPRSPALSRDQDAGTRSGNPVDG